MTDAELLEMIERAERHHSNITAKQHQDKEPSITLGKWRLVSVIFLGGLFWTREAAGR